MKITPEMEAMYSKLVSIAPIATARNDAKKYLGLMVDGRIVIGVHRKGTSFSTQDKDLLASLDGARVEHYKVTPDEGRKKYRYMFPELTIDKVEAHIVEFRKLIEDSIRLKRGKSSPKSGSKSKRKDTLQRNATDNARDHSQD